MTKNMKSRFLRILLIINGILIPIFIIYVLGYVLIEKYNDYTFYNSGNSNLESLEIKGPKYEIKQSSLIGIPNSENFKQYRKKKMFRLKKKRFWFLQIIILAPHKF